MAYSRKKDNYRWFPIGLAVTTLLMMLLVGCSTPPSSKAAGKNHQIVKSKSAKKDSTIIGNSKNPPLYIVNGKIVDQVTAHEIDPRKIKSMHVWKGKDAVKKFGKKGKNGVVVITTKNNGLNAHTSVVKLPQTKSKYQNAAYSSLIVTMQFQC